MSAASFSYICTYIHTYIHVHIHIVYSYVCMYVYIYIYSLVYVRIRRYCVISNLGTVTKNLWPFVACCHAFVTWEGYGAARIRAVTTRAQWRYVCKAIICGGGIIRALRQAQAGAGCGQDIWETIKDWARRCNLVNISANILDLRNALAVSWGVYY